MMWWGREAWPRYRSDPMPHETQAENGMSIVIDVATPDDDLCDATTTMLHGLDRERRTAVCIMPAGHDTPHMPQDEATLERAGRLIIRSIST